jgi:putative flippase GtrA
MGFARPAWLPPGGAAGRADRFARVLLERYRALTGEAIRFLIVGGTAFGLTVGGTDALHQGAGLGPLLANALANVAAACFAFAAHKYWTFRHRPEGGRSREFVYFFILNAAGLAVQQLFIWFTRDVLDETGVIALNIALVAGIGVATLFRFWSYRKWVFLAGVLPGPGGEAPGEAAGPAPPSPAPR